MGVVRHHHLDVFLGIGFHAFFHLAHWRYELQGELYRADRYVHAFTARPLLPTEKGCSTACDRNENPGHHTTETENLSSLSVTSTQAPIQTAAAEYYL